MRVAVIGVGQLGRAILDRCWDRQTWYSDHHRQGEPYHYCGIPHAKLDVASPSATEYLVSALSKFKPDVVINTAAMHVTQECENDPLGAFAVNAAGAKNVAVACVILRAMHVYVSTDYVFSNLVRAEGMFDVLDRPHPTTIYGLSKLAGEHVTRRATPNSAVVRVSHLFGGQGSRQKGGNLVLNVLERLRREEQLSYYENIWFTPTSCRDAAKMILSVRDPGVYHACNLGRTTPYLFAKAVVKFAGADQNLVKAVTFSEDETARFAHPRVTTMVPTFQAARKWEEALADYMPQARRHTEKS